MMSWVYLQNGRGFVNCSWDSAFVGWKDGLPCRHEVGCSNIFHPYFFGVQFSLPWLLRAAFLNHQLNHSVTWRETRWKFAEAKILPTGWLKWQHFFSYDAEATRQGISGAGFCSELSSVGRCVSISVSLHRLPLVWVYIFSSYQVTDHIGLETELYDLLLA